MLAAVIVVVVGVVAYQHFAAPAAARTSAQTRARHTPAAKTKARSGPVTHHRSTRLDIVVTATQNCFIQLTTAQGKTIFSGLVYAGTSKQWIERQAVSMIIGYPAGIRLTVNGKDPVPPGQTSPLTLTLRASRA